MTDRTLAMQALCNLDDAMWQTIAEMAGTDDPKTLAELSGRLDQLDSGRIRVDECHRFTASSQVI